MSLNISYPLNYTFFTIFFAKLDDILMEFENLAKFVAILGRWDFKFDRIGIVDELGNFLRIFPYW